MTFLCWNLRKKPLEHSIACLAMLKEIDVIMLIESEITSSTLLNLLNQQDSADYFYCPSISCKKIQIYTKFSNAFVETISEDEDLTIRQFRLPGLIPILLAVIHAPSAP